MFLNVNNYSTISLQLFTIGTSGYIVAGQLQAYRFHNNYQNWAVMKQLSTRLTLESLIKYLLFMYTRWLPLIFKSENITAMDSIIGIHA